MGGSQVRDSSGVRTHGAPVGHSHSGQLSSSHSHGEHFGHTGHTGGASLFTTFRTPVFSSGLVLSRHHDSGHSKRDVMPSGDTTEVTSQLNRMLHFLLLGP